MIFFVSLHSVGMVAPSGAVADPSGPRNWGQVSAAGADRERAAVRTGIAKVRIGESVVKEKSLAK